MKASGQVVVTALVLGTFAGLVIYSTRSAYAAPPKPATLSGHVTDGIGNPLAGVTVSLDGRITDTDTNGDYYLDNIEPGSYVVSFSAPGYETLIR